MISCYHILDRIDKIESILLTIKTYRDFEEHWLEQYALLKSMIDIGEATNDLSRELYDRVSHLDLGTVVGMRNKISHGYHTVDLTRVWDALQNDIPTLKREIKKIQKMLKENKFKNQQER